MQLQLNSITVICACLLALFSYIAADKLDARASRRTEGDAALYKRAAKEGMGYALLKDAQGKRSNGGASEKMHPLARSANHLQKKSNTAAKHLSQGVNRRDDDANIWTEEGVGTASSNFWNEVEASGGLENFLNQANANPEVQSLVNEAASDPNLWSEVGSIDGAQSALEQYAADPSNLWTETASRRLSNKRAVKEALVYALLKNAQRKRSNGGASEKKNPMVRSANHLQKKSHTAARHLSQGVNRRDDDAELWTEEATGVAGDGINDNDLWSQGASSDDLNNFWNEVGTSSDATNLLNEVASDPNIWSEVGSIDGAQSALDQFAADPSNFWTETASRRASNKRQKRRLIK